MVIHRVIDLHLDKVLLRQYKDDTALETTLEAVGT